MAGGHRKVHLQLSQVLQVRDRGAGLDVVADLNPDEADCAVKRRHDAFVVESGLGLGQGGDRAVQVRFGAVILALGD